MHLSRRQVMAGAAALVVMPKGAQAAPRLLTARPGVQQLAPADYAATPIWGFDGKVPGPELRVAQGGRLSLRFQNDLPQASAIHWHGIRIANKMDGVPGMTQDAVPPGGSFDYDFALPDAGSYWYHSHNKSVEQVARGLYGPLIIDEPTPPDIDRDLVLMVDDWRLDGETLEITADFGNGRDNSHGGRLGNLVTVNGQFNAQITAARHERLRLRLVNPSNARNFGLRLQGLAGWVMALDGMPLAAPQELTARLDLAPAQRVDLMVDVTAEPGGAAGLLSVERTGIFRIWDVNVADGSTARRAAPPALPPNALPNLPPMVDIPVAEMVMQGGAMRWLETATMSDTELSGRDLAQLGQFWALNGQVGRAPAPFIDAKRGDAWRLRFVNDTAFDHGMHLHGHHFALLDDQGQPGAWRDTVLLRRGETREVVTVLDNPGTWLLHCHMLGHAASGMTSWLRVS